MPFPIQLRNYIEECLKAEGLHSVLTDSQRNSIFRISGIIFWFLFLWITHFGFLLYATPDNWLLGLLFIPTAFALCLLAVLLLVKLKMIRAGITTNVNLSNGESLFLSIYLFVFLPILASMVSAYVAASIFFGILQLFGFTASLMLSLILYHQKFRIFQVLEFFRSVVKVLIQSVTAVLILLPILSVIVLLGVFSEDMWRVLGTLSSHNLIWVSILLLLPSPFLMITAIRNNLNQVSNLSLTFESIIHDGKNYPFLKTKISRGLISKEELDELELNLKWRSAGKIFDGLFPVIRRKTLAWLTLLLLLTSLLVTLVFTIYFVILFKAMFPENVLLDWTNIPNLQYQYTLIIGEQQIIYTINSAEKAMLKVSLVLSCFMTLAANVYSLTDESASKKITEWLNAKVSTWVSLASLYDAIIHPGYQVWEFKAKDKKKGVVNALIVVPKDSTNMEVNKACEHFATEFSDFKYVTITAYESAPDSPLKLNSFGKSWIYSKYVDSPTPSFHTFPVVDEEENLNPYLGLQCLRSGATIPDQWFGYSSESVNLGKQIWNLDPDRAFILHPSALINDKAVFLDIKLFKRLENSILYRNLLHMIFYSTLSHSVNIDNVEITVKYRDEDTVLASLSWYKSLNKIEYKDEFRKKNKYESSSPWLTPPR